eukprot:1161045-Pelagomonas_calceolata.AAC.4
MHVTATAASSEIEEAPVGPEITPEQAAAAEKRRAAAEVSVGDKGAGPEVGVRDMPRRSSWHPGLQLRCGRYSDEHACEWCTRLSPGTCRRRWHAGLRCAWAGGPEAAVVNSTSHAGADPLLHVKSEQESSPAVCPGDGAARVSYGQTGSGCAALTMSALCVHACSAAQPTRFLLAVAQLLFSACMLGRSACVFSCIHIQRPHARRSA